MTTTTGPRVPVPPADRRPAHPRHPAAVDAAAPDATAASDATDATDMADVAPAPAPAPGPAPAPAPAPAPVPAPDTGQLRQKKSKPSRSRHHAKARASERPEITAAGLRQLRVVTANIQSFPDDALTLDQALADLRQNARDGDLVLLQEIAGRYRPLVAEAFPDAEWDVFYGENDNHEPIAARRGAFTRVEARATLLHPARAKLHTARYETYVRLRYRPLDCDLHVTNLHLVAGAFSVPPAPRHEERVREWNEGIAKHLALVESLVRTGQPVLGGGDYNRQLKRHKPLGTAIAGRPVTYAVGKGAIDLLWFVDGDDHRWQVSDTALFPGRGRSGAQRNSDHGARLATVLLTDPTEGPMTNDPTTPIVIRHPHDERPGKRPRKHPKPARHGTPTPTETPEGPAHPPFERTTFGDVRPKTVDWKTRAALEEAQRRLGYPLTVVQGSYNAGGVSQSAGTHDKGGVVDLLAWDSARKVRVLRSIGFAAWYRPAITGLWGAHIHAVLIDHGLLATSAAAQVASYRAGRDGLKGNRTDPTWRPDPIPVFAYPPAPSARHADDAPREPGPPAGSPHPLVRTLDGVDTSHHQGGRIDLKAAQAAGVRWWYVKATEGTSFVDPTYAARVRQARRAGLPVGAYHFARPDGHDALAEAAFFLKAVDIRAGDMLPMLDLESTEGLSPAALTAWTGTWVGAVTQELARRRLVARPIIYTPFNLGNGFGCLLWVARYSDSFRAPVIPKPWQRAAIWQHSNGQLGAVTNVPGFGHVDANAVHPDLPMSALRVASASAPATTRPGRHARSDRPGRRARSQPVPPAPPVPTPSPGGVEDELLQVRRELRAAVENIGSALDGLPER